MTRATLPATFVVSTGRAGSMMLARALDRVPGVRAVHEPEPHLVVEGYLRWRGRLGGRDLERRILEKRRPLTEAAASAGMTYLESSNYCSHIIPELARLFDARFVFLHRDPRGFTRSGLARRRWYTPRPWRERVLTAIRRRTGLHVGYLWYDHKLEPPAELTTRMERIAWLWTEINSVILRDLETLPSERKLEFRLDETGAAAFERLATFVAGERPTPEVRDAMLAEARAKPNRRRPAPLVEEPWDEAAFQAITGSIAQRLGYALGSSP